MNQGRPASRFSPLPLLLLCVPSSSAACATCLSTPENAALARVLSWGLFALTGTLFSLLAAGTIWFIRMERHRKDVDARYFGLPATEPSPR